MTDFSHQNKNSLVQMALFNTLQNEDLIFNFNFLKYVLYLNLYGAGFDNIC